MTDEIKIDQEKKIIQRTVTGELDANRALTLVQKVSLAAQINKDYNILVDIRDTTFNPEMMDLLGIAVECSKQLLSFHGKIAFVIPDTKQRKEVAKLFKTCMESQGFDFRQFFDYEAAIEWLSD